MGGYDVYQAFIKPSWAPPASVFGPVWTVLYVLIAISFGAVFYKVSKGTIPFSIMIPFALNLLFNLIYTPIQFGLLNNTLAAIDIVLVLGTLIWALIAIWPYAKWIALINIPYLAWVSFATVLQLSITVLNWK
ncbi:MAG TPA: TspO/MBR family protein [Candidatus Paceibacterota bacterium]|jgi:tryptophan-rich sensory protein|nr:TspO/MBR family protein [Candidatus Paceibacterota bacterium]